jgi:hypothetical protein
VRRCVRPDHLWLGTYRDNLHDAHQKGRLPQWGDVTNPRAKLTAESVREIRASAERTGALSRRYGVNRSTIQNVLSRKSFRSVT